MTDIYFLMKPFYDETTTSSTERIILRVLPGKAHPRTSLSPQIDQFLDNDPDRVRLAPFIAIPVGHRSIQSS
jgi:hypothetical protein